jgi:DNA-binding SARP family transcriptional activator/tetratricopeptide (TPR) repeat protein
MTMLHVALLGEQGITDSTTGTVLTRSPRSVALVAFLVAHAGVPQQRQHIAELFWPDSTDAQALTNLRRELHHLRQVLGNDRCLVVTSKDLCWRDTHTCRVDMRTFDLERRAALAAAAIGDTEEVLAHATAALAEYRGELLPGMYDDWLVEVRTELERHCVYLCDLLSAARSRQGDLTGAIDIARRRIALRPLEEVGYRTLMELQAALGDRASAVSTYHHCASILERELGITPDRATTAVVSRLLAAQGAPAIGRSGMVGSEFVGRATEFALLLDIWRAAVSGQPRLALVLGGAGVGKTRLLAEIADVARRHGAVVAVTQCFGASGGLALAPVADWLRTPAVRSAVRRLDPAWRAEVDRLVPAGPKLPAAAVDAWQRHRFFEGLARALTGIGQPVLLVLDNIQWCDQETLAFLVFCLERASGTPILVAATCRDDHPDENPGILAWTARMRATGLLTELPLSPLEPADTARLAEAIAGRPLDAADNHLLQATTGGFPLYVVEAIRSAVDIGDSRLPVGDLPAVLRGRLAQASPAAREIAGLAAAVGRNFTLDLLTEASGLGADDVVQAVDELWRRRIISERPDGYDFSHELLRDTAYRQVSPPKRWLLHRRLAESLELLHTDDTATVSAQLAEQYARGGQPDRAVAHYRRAADIASSTFAHGEAIRLHKAALSIVRDQPAGRRRQIEELAILEALAAPLNARYGFSSPELQRALEEAIGLAEALGRQDATLASLVGLWASQFVQGRTADAHRTASRALTMAADSELSGFAHFAFGGSAVSLGRPAVALRHFTVAELTTDALSLTIGTRPDVHSRAWAAHAHWLLGQDAAALSSCTDAITTARAIDHPYNLAVALGYAGITHQMRRDTAELRAVVGELRHLCDRYNFAYYREWGLVLDGWSRGGEAGIELARRGIDNLKSEGALARMPYWLSLLADLQRANGDAGAARATLDAALVAGQVRDDLWWLPEVQRLRAGYDTEPVAIVRLRAAARLAAAHGSSALHLRCEHDLADRGIPADVS